MRLDPFGGDLQAERATEVNHGMNDDRAFARRFQRLQERAINLDFVEGETAQIDEARIAGAEIVECEPHAHGA